MILNLSKYVKEVFDALEVSKDKRADKAMEISTILAMVFSEGMGAERQRIKPIVQRKSMNPMDVIREIERPIR